MLGKEPLNKQNTALVQANLELLKKLDKLEHKVSTLNDTIVKLKHENKKLEGKLSTLCKFIASNNLVDVLEVFKNHIGVFRAKALIDKLPPSPPKPPIPHSVRVIKEDR